MPFCFRKKHQEGFTLIELLVVISLITIFSSVVLVIINNTRNRARDAAIKANMAQIPNLAEEYYFEHSSYGDDLAIESGQGFDGNPCLSQSDSQGSNYGIDNNLFGSSYIKKIIDESLIIAGRGDLSRCSVGQGGQSWAVSVPLAGQSSPSWCLDSQGNARTGLVALGGGSDTAAFCGQP